VSKDAGALREAAGPLMRPSTRALRARLRMREGDA
jgi:hypothetical protein